MIPIQMISKYILFSDTFNRSQLLTNNKIQKNIDFPRELAHEDYKYLSVGEGPLYQNKKENSS